MNYPRVLVITGGRINAADSANNGLLLRNLFGAWPSENLAQIYSSGDNGDEGYFGRYYQLGTQDRRLGWIFYKLKTEALDRAVGADGVAGSHEPSTPLAAIRLLGKRLLMDTGLYELVFRPQLSYALQAWLADFQPDIIFAQGYSLAFTWLPLMLADRYQLPIVYYPTDDWPDDLYSSTTGFPRVFAKLVRRIVSHAAYTLVDRSSVRLAFNRFMQEEYYERYGKEFVVIMHGDSAARFEAAQPRRLVGEGEYSVVCTGTINANRLPLLADLDLASEILHTRGLEIRTTVFPVNQVPVALTRSFRYIRFGVCPNHDDLVSVLKGADILFLPERFGETARQVSCSVSTKAHLFMFSGRPIIVYSGPETGITRYAKSEGWAAVIERRDPLMLADIIEELLTDVDACQSLVSAARSCALRHHDLQNIRSKFMTLLDNAVRSRDRS